MMILTGLVAFLGAGALSLWVAMSAVALMRRGFLEPFAAVRAMNARLRFSDAGRGTGDRHPST